MSLDEDLLKKLKIEFERKYESNSKVKILLKELNGKKANYVNVHELSIEVGKILAETFMENISSDILPDAKMTYQTALAVVDPMLRENYLLLSKASIQAQKMLNENANIGLKVKIPKINEDKIDGIVRKVSSYENYDDAKWVLNEPVVNFTQSVSTDVLRENFEFHGKNGLRPTIKRIVMDKKPCKWCRNLAGTYRYGNVPRDVYRRHENCRCLVSYDPGDSKGKVQDVWSKEWVNEQDVKNRIEINKRKKEALEKKKQEQAIARKKREEDIKLLKKEMRMGSKRAVIFYNTHKKEIEELGIIEFIRTYQ